MSRTVKVDLGFEFIVDGGDSLICRRVSLSEDGIRHFGVRILGFERMRMIEDFERGLPTIVGDRACSTASYDLLGSVTEDWEYGTRVTVTWCRKGEYRQVG